MNKKVLITAAVILVIIVAGYFLLGNQSNKPPQTTEQISGTTVPPGRKVIKIGAILPLTGSSATAADFAKKGLELSKHELNKILELYQIEIIYGDSKNQAKEGINVYRKMRADGIKIFISIQSGVSVPLSQVVKKDPEVLLFVTISSAPGIPESGANIFRIFVNVENEVRTTLEFLKQKGLKKIGVFYINDDFGLSGYTALKKFVKSTDVQILWADSYDKDKSDFRNVVSSNIRKSDGIDIIYVIGYDKPFGIIIKQIREAGFKKSLITTVGLSIPAWRKIAGAAANNAFFTNTSFNSENKDNVLLSKFIENYKKYYKTDSLPNSLTGFSYETLNIIGSSLLDGKLKVNDISKDILSKKKYESVFGTINFNDKGEADLDLTINQIKDNKVVNVK